MNTTTLLPTGLFFACALLLACGPQANLDARGDGSAIQRGDAPGCPYPRDPAICDQDYRACVEDAANVCPPGYCTAGDIDPIYCTTVCANRSAQLRSDCAKAKETCARNRCADWCQPSSDPRVAVSDGRCPEGETCVRAAADVQAPWTCRAIAGTCRKSDDCDTLAGSVCIQEGGARGWCSKTCTPWTSDGCGPSAPSCAFISPGESYTSFPSATSCEPLQPSSNPPHHCKQDEDCPDGRSCDWRGTLGASEIIGTCGLGKVEGQACTNDNGCGQGLRCSGGRCVSKERGTSRPIHVRYRDLNDQLTSCAAIGGAEFLLLTAAGFVSGDCALTDGMASFYSHYKIDGVAWLLDAENNIIGITRIWDAGRDGLYVHFRAR